MLTRPEPDFTSPEEAQSLHLKALQAINVANETQTSPENHEKLSKYLGDVKKTAQALNDKGCLIVLQL